MMLAWLLEHRIVPFVSNIVHPNRTKARPLRRRRRLSRPAADRDGGDVSWHPSPHAPLHSSPHPPPHSSPHSSPPLQAADEPTITYGPPPLVPPIRAYTHAEPQSTPSTYAPSRQQAAAAATTSAPSDSSAAATYYTGDYSDVPQRVFRIRSATYSRRVDRLSPPMLAAEVEPGTICRGFNGRWWEAMSRGVSSQTGKHAFGWGPVPTHVTIERVGCIECVHQPSNTRFRVDLGQLAVE